MRLAFAPAMKCWQYLGLGIAIVALTGCDAYSKGMSGALNSGLVTVVDGSFDVQNALSIPVCGLTILQPKDMNREQNDLLQVKVIQPGATAHVNIPHVGKAEDSAAPGTTYSLKVFGCTEPKNELGTLIKTIPDIDPKKTPKVIIH